MLSPVSVIDLYSEGNLANDPEMSSAQIEIPMCALKDIEYQFLDVGV